MPRCWDWQLMQRLKVSCYTSQYNADIRWLSRSKFKFKCSRHRRSSVFFRRVATILFWQYLNPLLPKNFPILLPKLFFLFLRDTNKKYVQKYQILGWDLAIARYQPRPCGQQGGFAPTFFSEMYLAKVFFENICYLKFRGGRNKRRTNLWTWRIHVMSLL